MLALTIYLALGVLNLILTWDEAEEVILAARRGVPSEYHGLINGVLVVTFIMLWWIKLVVLLAVWFRTHFGAPPDAPT